MHCFQNFIIIIKLLILSLVVGKVSCTDKKDCFQGFVIIIIIIILIRSVEFF